MSDPRLKGQEIEIRVFAAGVRVTEIAAIGSFNDQTNLELKEDGFLGEPVNRFDEVLNGFGGDFEFQVTEASWIEFQEQIIARAKREQPELRFNVIRTDFFANGSTLIITYEDVNWGAQPTAVASRGDFVKVRAEFRSSKRSVQVNSLP